MDGGTRGRLALAAIVSGFAHDAGLASGIAQSHQASPRPTRPRCTAAGTGRFRHGCGRRRSLDDWHRDAHERCGMIRQRGSAGAVTTILVVDDEPQIAETATDYLRLAGYDVTPRTEAARARS